MPGVSSRSATGAISTVHLSLCTVLTDTEGTRMSKKRRRQLSVQTLPQPKPDARREVAARASKALRSAETMKLRNTLIQAYDQELHYELRKVPNRPARRQSLPQTSDQRRVPTPTELRRSPLPAQVRNQLQDGIRALACRERRSRKEVIFAMRRAGKAGTRNKKAKWTEKSYMRCK